jgi:flagellar motility protein MotE (MotC chaperone)
MMQGTGLLRAAAIGAIALLGLKVVGFVYDQTPADQEVAARAPRPGELPHFARSIAKARQNYVPVDPDVTGSVSKKEDDKAKDKDKAKDAKPVAPAPDTPSELSKAGVFNGKIPPTPAERALLERLGERRGELDSRAREIDTREKLLENAEKKLESRIGDLRTLEEKLGDTFQKKTKVEAQGFKNLVTMYESMKPKDAARVFDRLPHDVLIPVVQEMNPRKMSEVLASMTPESAEKLTVALAMRARDANSRLGPPTADNLLPAGELQAIDPAAGRGATQRTN